MAEENGIIVSGGIRYTKRDAEARGLKPDTAAQTKKIANGDVPVGTYVATKAGDAQSIPAPAGTAGEAGEAGDPAPVGTAGNTAPAGKK